MAKEIKFMMLRDYLLADKLSPIFTEILKERINQVDKFGEQNHPMYRIIPDPIIYCDEQYPANSVLKNMLDRSRSAIEKGGCWFDILLEEICEAFLEKEPEKQREEMIHVAAVVVAIIEYLDREIEGASNGH
jgi:hypothetical protein